VILNVDPIPFILIVVSACAAMFESGRTYEVNKMLDKCQLLDAWERELSERDTSNTGAAK
jgi:hypothetical protein